MDFPTFHLYLCAKHLHNMAKVIARNLAPMEIFQLSRYEQDQFPLGATFTNYHRAYPSHSHDFTELALVFSGRGSHVGPDGEYPFRAGDVFVIEPGAFHSYQTSQQFALCNIMFDAKRLHLPGHDLRQLPGYHALFHLEPSTRRQHPGNLRLNSTDLETVRGLIDRLLAELKERTPGYQSLSTAIFTELVVFLSRRVEGADVRGRNTQAISKALSYMERHFTKAITLEDMARNAGMSVRNFQRRFKESVGVTPFQRLQEIRIGYAKTLLRDPELSVAQVAFRSGFKDSNYFCRQFRNVENVSPSRYLQQLK